MLHEDNWYVSLWKETNIQLVVVSDLVSWTLLTLILVEC